MKRRHLLKYFGSGLLIPLAPISLAEASARTGRRLILVELSGANDGFNTVVPINDHRYAEIRPNIAIKPENAFAIGADFFLNTALSELGQAWEDGQLAIVHGLGYPLQNKSHFQSIALWETGGDGNGSGDNGWLTEDIQNLDGADELDAHGISLDGGMGVFAANSGLWLSMTSFSQLETLHERVQATGFGSQNSNSASNNPALQLLLDRGHALDTSMERIAQKLGNSVNHVTYRGAGEFGHQIGMAVHLIRSGINAPVIKLKIGSFDTHEHQEWQHNRLLEHLALGLSTLKTQLQNSGHWDDTLVMTYSEFGRRAVENRSFGTDHGTAAPHFALGGRVQGGLWGQPPNLGRLIDGDVEFTMDYRSLYHRVLADWFGLTNNRFANYEDTRLSGIVL